MKIRIRLKPVIVMLAVMLLLYCVWSIAFASTTGIVTGVITDAKTGAKLSGVNVVLKGTNLTTVTDANGYFVITNVPPGSYAVEVSLVGYTSTIEEDVEVTMDVSSSIDFELTQEVSEEQEVAVTEKKKLVQPDVTPTLYIVDFNQEKQVKSQPNNLYQIPGLVTVMPGVTPDADGRPHIRGGRDTQVGYMLDGIPIVEPNTNVFATNTVTVGLSKLQIYTGGYRAEYGNAMSGIFNEVVKTGSEIKGGGMETTGGDQSFRSAYVEYGDVAPNGLDYYVGTYNWSTKFQNMFFAGTDSSDTIGKFVYPVNDDNRLTLLINQGSARYYLDDIHYYTYHKEPVKPEEDHGHQGYRILGLTWAHNFSPSSFMTIRPYTVNSYALIDTLAPEGQMGQWMNWWSNQKGLQLEYTNQLTQNHLIKTGASVIDAGNFYHTWVPNMLGNDVDYEYTSAADTRQTAAFVQNQVKFGDFNVETGLRFDRMRFDKVVDSDIAQDQISPRIGLTYNQDKKSVWRASWGRFIQFPPAYVMDRIYTDPSWNSYRMGSINLKPERSWSVDLGYERQLDDTTLVKLTPFYREYTDLIQSQKVPPPAGPRVYVNAGEGKSYGLEGYFSRKFNNNWDGWLSYTYMQARANSSSFTGSVVPGVMTYVDWDQRHTVTAVLNYRHKTWYHNFMINYGSGFADGVDATTAEYQERASSNLICSWNINKELPKGSKLGDTVFLNVYNVFNVKKANHRYVTPLFDDDYNITGFAPEDDTWTVPRFITLGVTRRF